MPLVPKVSRDLIALEPIQGPYIRHLVDILNNDAILAASLSSSNEPVSIEQFVEHNDEWAKRTNSKMFAIVLNNKAIGSISLSHIDPENKTAHIGYWIESINWGKGYGSAAFARMLEAARNMGVTTVSSTIDQDNQRSKALWSKHGAVFTEENGSVKASLRI